MVTKLKILKFEFFNDHICNGHILEWGRKQVFAKKVWHLKSTMVKMDSIQWEHRHPYGFGTIHSIEIFNHYPQQLAIWFWHKTQLLACCIFMEENSILYATIMIYYEVLEFRLSTHSPKGKKKEMQLLILHSVSSCLLCISKIMISTICFAYWCT